MKKRPLILTLLVVVSLKLMGQKQISVRLSSTQINKVKIKKTQAPFIEISFEEEVDNILLKYKFKDFYQSYRLAKFFTHEATVGIGAPATTCPISGSIAGPTVAAYYQNCSWTMTPSGGNGTYTYHGGDRSIMARLGQAL